MTNPIGSGSYPLVKPAQSCLIPSFAHIFGETQHDQALLTSILTLSAFLRTCYGTSESENLDLNYEDGTVTLSHGGSKIVYKQTFAEALRCFANDCNGIDNSLLADSHNLFTLSFEAPRVMQFEEEDIESSFMKILKSDNPTTILAGVKLWTALASAPVGEKTKWTIIEILPEIITSANPLLRQQLQRSLPPKAQDLLSDGASLKKVAFGAMDLLYQLNHLKTAAKVWIKYLRVCASVEYSSHPVGLDLQRTKLRTLTFGCHNALLGLQYINTFVLTDQYQYIPFMLHRVHKESGLDDRIIPCIKPVILLMEKMVGTPSDLPDSAIESYPPHSSIEQINALVDSFLSIGPMGRFPLAQSMNAEHQFSVDPLDYITSSPLSHSLIATVSYSLSRFDGLIDYQINLFGAAVAQGHENLAQNILERYFRGYRIRSAQCLKLLAKSDPSQAKFDPSIHLKMYENALLITFANIRSHSFYHIVADKITAFEAYLAIYHSSLLTETVEQIQQKADSELNWDQKIVNLRSQHAMLNKRSWRK